MSGGPTGASGEGSGGSAAASGASGEASAAPRPAVLDEAARLRALTDEAAIRVRLLGGVGVALHAHAPIDGPFLRTYGDLDYVVAPKDAPRFRRLLEASGYDGNDRFNALHGHKRLLHYDDPNGRQVDTFVGTFRMCHRVDLADRLALPGVSLPPADLLLTKLQIVQVNDKDLLDTLLLLRDHEVGDDPAESIERDRLARIVGDDWGWFTTLADNLEKLRARIATLEAAADLRALLEARVTAVQRTIEEAPKGLRWRTRATMGRRVPWYELPEEVGGR